MGVCQPQMQLVETGGATCAPVTQLPRDELRIAIVTWIEKTHHRRRRQDALGRSTPIEYEMIMNQTVALAA